MTDKNRIKVVVAGRGSGKSEIAKRHTVLWLPVKKPWRDPKYFFALPTFSQARRVAWADFKALIPPRWIKDISESRLEITTVFGSSLTILGLDKPQRAEGVQWDGGVVDESSDQKPKVVDLSLGPAMTHRNPWLWRIGVPKRYGIGAFEFQEAYDYAVSGEDPDWKAYHWESASVLTDKQLAHWKRVLDTRDFNEQYRASWEQAGGNIFYSFDPKLDCTQTVAYNSDKPVIVGSDFNVDPMSWCLAQEHETKHGTELHVFDEISIQNTNTPATLDELDTRFDELNAPPEWIFHGDAASKQRHTNASSTDYLLIAGDQRFTPKRVLYPRANPALKDRFASTNMMFCSADGKRRVKIHPRCTKLIADLRRRSYKAGTSSPDDSGNIGHMTDAFSYIVHSRHPVKVAVNGTAGVAATAA